MSESTEKFLMTPCPTYTVSSTIDVPHQCGTIVITEEQILIHHYQLKSIVSNGDSHLVCIVKSFDDVQWHVLTTIVSYRRISPPEKSLGCINSFLSTSNPWQLQFFFFYCLSCFVFPRMLHSWNHTVFYCWSPGQASPKCPTMPYWLF